jgi:hypothetical protein
MYWYKVSRHDESPDTVLVDARSPVQAKLGARKLWVSRGRPAPLASRLRRPESTTYRRYLPQKRGQSPSEDSGAALFCATVMRFLVVASSRPSRRNPVDLYRMPSTSPSPGARDPHPIND